MLKYFSPFGRAKRLEYWCLVAVSHVFSFLGNEVYQSVESRSIPQSLVEDWKGHSVVLVLLLLSTTISFFAARRRCEDIGILTIYAFFILFGGPGIIVMIILGLPRTDFARDPRVLKKIDSFNDMIDRWTEEVMRWWLFLKQGCPKKIKKNDNNKDNKKKQ